jgi:hypothetical protein
MGTGILLVAEHLASTAACNEFEPQIDSSRNLVFLHSVRHSGIPGKVGRPMQMQFYFREVQPPSLQTFFCAETEIFMSKLIRHSVYILLQVVLQFWHTMKKGFPSKSLALFARNLRLAFQQQQLQHPKFLANKASDFEGGKPFFIVCQN